MRVLGIDGALGGFSAALLDGEIIVEEGSDRPDALEAGLGRIAAVLAARHLRLADLDRIAVGVGPGSFTGVRIAVSYARALAFAQGLPLTGISSYDVLTPEVAPPVILTVVHGRTGIVLARLRRPEGDRTASGPIARVLDELLAEMPHDEMAICGKTDGVSFALIERGIAPRALPARVESPAAAIARLGSRSKVAASVHAVGPDYGELPAAER